MHALVVGVSEYEKPLSPNHKSQFELLYGTAPAATHFARFLLHDFHHPGGIPLRSIRLLLSPPKEMTAEQRAEYLLTEGRPSQPASFQNVAHALEVWAEDCDRHADNVAIMFVAGHGVATSTQARWAFLPEAGSLKQIYTYGINVTALKQGMALHRARTQIFIWDLCALVSDLPDYLPAVGAAGPRTNQDADLWDNRMTIGATVLPPERKAGEEHPGGVNQVAIVSRLGTKTWSLNAIRGTILTTALVGRDADDFKQRLMSTAVSIDDHHQVAVTAQRVGELLPDAVRSQIKGDPGAVEHIVMARNALVGLNRPDPLPVFTVEFVWTDIRADEVLYVKITQRRPQNDTKTLKVPKVVVRSFELQSPPDGIPMHEPVELRAGSYRVEWDAPPRPGRSYDLRVSADVRIDMESGDEL